MTEDTIRALRALVPSGSSRSRSAKDGTTYPHMGVIRSLRDVTDRLSDNKSCNPLTKAKQNPEVERRLRELKIPDNQRCLASAAIESHMISEQQRALDRRMTRVPRGTLPGNDRYVSLSDIAKAKIHINRCRQMFWFGITLLRKGIDTQKSEFFKKSNALIGLDEPVGNKTTATSELLIAYLLIKTFERTPGASEDDEGIYRDIMRDGSDTALAIREIDRHCPIGPDERRGRVYWATGRLDETRPFPFYRRVRPTPEFGIPSGQHWDGRCACNMLRNIHGQQSQDVMRGIRVNA